MVKQAYQKHAKQCTEPKTFANIYVPAASRCRVVCYIPFEHGRVLEADFLLLLVDSPDISLQLSDPPFQATLRGGGRGTSCDRRWCGWWALREWERVWVCVLYR